MTSTSTVASKVSKPQKAKKKGTRNKAAKKEPLKLEAVPIADEAETQVSKTETQVSVDETVEPSGVLITTDFKGNAIKQGDYKRMKSVVQKAKDAIAEATKAEQTLCEVYFRIGAAVLRLQDDYKAFGHVLKMPQAKAIIGFPRHDKYLGQIVATVKRFADAEGIDYSVPFLSYRQAASSDRSSRIPTDKLIAAVVDNRDGPRVIEACRALVKKHCPSIDGSDDLVLGTMRTSLRCQVHKEDGRAYNVRPDRTQSVIKIGDELKDAPSAVVTMAVRLAADALGLAMVTTGYGTPDETKNPSLAVRS